MPDVRTLYALGSMVFTAVALATLFVWRQSLTASGLGRFPLGWSLIVLGHVLIALRGSISAFASVVVGNAVLMYGAGLLAEGTRLFYGLTPRRASAAVATAVVSLSSAYYFYVKPSTSTRVVVSSTLLAALAGVALLAALDGRKRRDEGLGALLVALSAGGSGAVLLLRAGATLAGVPPPGLLAGDWLSLTILLVGLCAGIGWTLGMMISVNARLTASLRDVNRGLAESEERYRSLVETPPDLICRVDELGYFTYLNQAGTHILGYAPEELVGRRVFDLMRPDYRKTVLAHYTRQALDQTPTTYFEFPAVTRDGREVWLGQNVQRLCENGRTVGYEAIARDITERKHADTDLVAQKKLLESLVALARATASGTGLDSTLRNTLDVANTLTGATASSLLLLDESGCVSHAIYTRGGDATVLAAPRSTSVMREGLAGWVARHRQSALVRDTLQDDRWLLVLSDDPPVRAALSVPIASGERLTGVLTLVHVEAGSFTEEHRRLMDAAAAQIALALHNAQISDAHLRLAERQTLVYEVLRACSRRRDPAETAETAADIIAHRTPWLHVVVGLPGEDGYWRLHGREAALGALRLRVKQGIIGRVFADGQAQNVPDVDADPDYYSSAAEIRSQLTVPLSSGARRLGVLSVESAVRAAFRDDDLRLAESLAEAISLALENAALYEAIAGESARLRAVIESSRDGLVLVGDDGRLLLVSDPALRQLDIVGRPEEWFGRPVETLLGAVASRAPRAADGLRTLTQSADGAPAQAEAAVGNKVLQWLSLEVSAVGRLLVFRDVTQERQAERMRETLTHTMVHDLRNPLTSILGALDLIEDTPDIDERGREFLRLARQNALKQLGLINSILDLSRLEQGALDLDRDALELKELVDEALRLAAPRAEAKGLDLVGDVPEGLPPAWADREVIARVLDNLVGNAIKFTPHGSVRVSAERSPAGLRVVVSDTGPGIFGEVRGRLFQKFAAGSEHGRGSGLGLAFCRLAVEAHGGEIWLSDEPGAPGARLVFTLPVSPALAAPPR